MSLRRAQLKLDMLLGKRHALLPHGRMCLYMSCGVAPDHARRPCEISCCASHQRTLEHTATRQPRHKMRSTERIAMRLKVPSGSSLQPVCEGLSQQNCHAMQ
eukprot:6203817-Pleurochrysis_carterae.AAC.2